MRDEWKLRALACHYSLAAPVYDSACAVLFYERARARAVELLHLEDGQTVLDVACGTGRNIPLLLERVGPRGHVIGVDYTRAMLARAREKARRRSWQNVGFLRLDAARLSLDALRDANLLSEGEQVDAVICTLALSCIPAWGDAYRAMLEIVRPGGRVAIMDTDYPTKAGATGERVAIRPLQMLICKLAGVAGGRQPWLRLPHDVDDAVIETFVGGYVGVAAGTA
jgi:demethylmenaquinone methyltransferase/2-methoxy-6-polyprenyl-1,4-benzoquinol methylase